MAMVGGDDRLADAHAGQTLQATSQVLHDPVHNPAGIERTGVLAGAINLSGTHYNDLGVANLLLNRLGVRGKDLVEGQIGKLGDSGFHELLSSRQIRKELPI